MALYPNLDSIVVANLPDNSTQYITAERHREVMEQAKDLGASQVYGPVATTFNPGTPQGPVAYITYRGTYTNFGAAVVTSSLGIIKWDGSAWAVTNIPLITPFHPLRAITSQARTAGSTYTSVTITQTTADANAVGGGWNAAAGEWVMLINHRTGQWEHVQLTAAMDDNDTSITFKSRKFAYDMPLGSIVEIYSNVGMWNKPHFPLLSGSLSYFNVTSDFRIPPVECTNAEVYLRYIHLQHTSGFKLSWEAGTGAPSAPYAYRIDSSDRTKFYTFEPMGESGTISLTNWQPVITETYTTS